jgi:hypothetical protein
MSWMQHPPVVTVLVVAGLVALVVAASSVLGRRRGVMLAGAVALAPALLFVTTHRAQGALGASRTMVASVEAPWSTRTTGLPEVAAWARTHTPPSARFLAPFLDPGFRATAKRGQVTDWKDGGLTLFSESLAERWMRLQGEVALYAERPEPEIIALARRHQCSYVIVPRARRLSLPIAHENDRYVVYAVPR